MFRCSALPSVRVLMLAKLCVLPDDAMTDRKVIPNIRCAASGLKMSLD